MKDAKYSVDDLNGLEDIYDLIKNDLKTDKLSKEIQSFKDIEKRYHNEKYVNEGGMKVIAADFDNYCHRKVARAELKPEIESTAVFIHEARILARLEHSNIVPLYDLGLDANDKPYFTMRLLGGENLQEILDKLNEGHSEYLKTYTEAYLREIFLKVCDAIAYAHTKGILHLDLKPANIQIDQFGEVLVCDWGLARSINEEDDDLYNPEGVINLKDSIDGNIKGTPGFMAPEQMDKTVSRSHRTDIYCLGALLYSILTYKTPIEASTLSEYITRTLASNFLSPQKRCPQHKIPDSLNAVVMKAMALKPEQRYHDVQDLVSEIRAYNHGFATQAENAGFTKLMSLLIKRYKLWFFSLSLVILLFSVTISYFLIKLQDEKILVEKALNKSQVAESQAREANEKSLALVKELQDEKNAKQALRKKTAPQLFQMALDQQRAGNFEAAKFIGTYALDLDPQNQGLKYLVALVYFGELNFEGCLKVLENYNGEENAVWLIEKSQAFVNKPPDIKTLHKFIVDLHAMPNFLKKNLRENLTHSITKKLSLEDRLEFAKLSLFRLNQYNSHYKIEKKAEGYALSLKNNKTFGNISCLHNLPLVSLDLTNTNVSDIKAISKIPLKELYLRNTRVIKIPRLNTSRLEKIDLSNTLITNIDFLENSPIKEIYLGSQWCNLKVLTTCKNFKILNIPKGRYGNDTLKKWGLLDKVVFTEDSLK